MRPTPYKEDENIFEADKSDSAVYRISHELKIVVKRLTQEQILHLTTSLKEDVHSRYLVESTTYAVPTKERRKDTNVWRAKLAKSGKLMSFSCEDCKATFKRKNHLKAHTDAVHLKIRPFSCKDCNTRFATRGPLNKHINVVHLKLRPFLCRGYENCKKDFGTKNNLQSHIAIVHKKRNHLFALIVIPPSL